MGVSETVKLTFDLVDKASKDLKNIDTRLRQVEGSTDKAGRSVNKFEQSVGSLGRTVAGSIAAYVSLNAAFSETQRIISKGLECEALNQKLVFATGSAEKAKEAFKFISEESERLGINLLSAGQGFAKFAAASKGTSLAGQETNNIFIGMSEASTALRLTTEQTNGAFVALEQIMSKGKVQAEELRGQLGERIPGAFQIASRAMGVTTQELDKMLSTGKVLATDFLPKFSRELHKTFAETAVEGAQSAQASFNRLSNSIDQARMSIAESGLIDDLARMSEVSTAFFKSFEGANTSAVFETFKGLVTGVKILDTGFTQLALRGENAFLRLSGAGDKTARAIQGSFKAYIPDVLSKALGITEKSLKDLDIEINKNEIAILNTEKAYHAAAASLWKYIGAINAVDKKTIVSKPTDFGKAPVSSKVKIDIEINDDWMDELDKEISDWTKSTNAFEELKSKFEDFTLTSAEREKKELNEFVFAYNKVAKELNKDPITVDLVLEGKESARIKQFESDLKESFSNSFESGISDLIQGGSLDDFASSLGQRIEEASADALASEAVLAAGREIGKAIGDSAGTEISAESGATSGAATGGIWGAVIGLVVGAVIGEITKSKDGGLSAQDFANNRLSEILNELEKQTNVLELQGLAGTAEFENITGLYDQINNILSEQSGIGQYLSGLSFKEIEEVKRTGSVITRPDQEFGQFFAQGDIAKLNMMQSLIGNYNDAILEGSAVFEQAGLSMQ